MEIGYRIIFNPENGKVLNYVLGEMSGDIQTDLRPSAIDFVDLPYGYSDNHFQTASRFHVDITTRQVVVDEYWDSITGQIVTVNP